MPNYVETGLILPSGRGVRVRASKFGLPKRARDYALKHKLTIGRKFDSTGKHAAFTLGSSMDPKSQQITQTEGGLMNRMRSEVKRRKGSGGGDVQVRSYTRSKPSR